MVSFIQFTITFKVLLSFFSCEIKVEQRTANEESLGLAVASESITLGETSESLEK